MKTLVLGLGNDLYGDDGVGLLVVRKLKEEMAGTPNRSEQGPWVDFEECCLSGISILDVISGYDDLVIIDTIKRPDPLTGRIHIMEENDLRAIPGPSPHYVSVPQMLAIGRASGLHVPARVRVVAVEAVNILEFSAGLSAEMQKSIPSIVKKVKEVLAGLKSGE